MEQRPLWFNDLDMQTTGVDEGIITEYIDDESSPKIRPDIAEFPNLNGGKWLSSYYGTKPIKAGGTIRSVTASGLEGKIDEFKLKLYPSAVGRLRTVKAGNYRDYDVIVKSIGIKREAYQTSMTPWEAEFEVVRAFGYRPDVYYRTSYSGITASSLDVNILSSGNAPYDPIIRLKVNSASQLGNVTMRNLATGDVMTFARQFSAGEQLEINLETGAMININGSGVTYSGIQMSFIAVSGTNPLRVTLASGTQNYDVSVAYKPKYL
jgi:hypothetical protein